MSGLSDDARKRIANELALLMSNRMRDYGGEVVDTIAILAEAMIGAHATVSVFHGVGPEVAAANCAALVSDHYAVIYQHTLDVRAQMQHARPISEKPN